MQRLASRLEPPGWRRPTSRRIAFLRPTPRGVIMATGRPQKGMNRRNHHDSISQSGQKNYGYSGQTRQPKYTISDAIMGKKPPKSSISASLFGSSNTSNDRKPFKSF